MHKIMGKGEKKGGKSVKIKKNTLSTVKKKKICLKMGTSDLRQTFDAETHLLF